MANNEMICHCMQVDYITIRKAMIDGARTIEDVIQATGATNGCGGCLPKVQEILDSVCGCTNTSMKDVKDAISNGADTVEKVTEITGAGSVCTRCNALIDSVIKNG